MCYQTYEEMVSTKRKTLEQIAVTPNFLVKLKYKVRIIPKKNIKQEKKGSIY
jgi:hypothetical protein